MTEPASDPPDVRPRDAARAAMDEFDLVCDDDCQAVDAAGMTVAAALAPFSSSVGPAAEDETDDRACEGSVAAVRAMVAACSGRVTGQLTISGWPSPATTRVISCSAVDGSEHLRRVLVRSGSAQSPTPLEPVPGDLAGVAVFEVASEDEPAGLVLLSADGGFTSRLAPTAQPGARLPTLQAALPASPNACGAVEAAWRGGGALTLRSVPLTSSPVAVEVDITAMRAGEHGVLVLHRAADSVVVASDTTDPAALRRLALYDELTGLPNRTLLRDRLENAFHRARRTGSVVAVAFIDLDGFKDINDNFGHALGDELLVAVGERLRHMLRESDTAARLGGDEFVLLFEGLADETQLATIFNRHAATLRRPYLLSVGPVVATASVGVVIGDARHASASDLLNEADAAMYEAKSRGSGRWVLFDETHHQQLTRTRELGEELRDAIPGRQLRLHYQPVTRVEDERIEECEALLRWRRRELKLLAPRQFLEAAERAHMMDALGAWALYEAGRQVERWEVHAKGLAVALNVAASQLGSAALPQVADAVLAQTRIAPEQLHFDLHTRTLSTLTRRAAADLKALNNSGVVLGIDDFGSAPISVSDLARHNIGYARLGHGVVRGLVDDAGVRVAAALIELGHRIGLRIVAPGVHSPEQLRVLRSLGCDSVQGYFIGRPRSADAIATMLKARA